MDSNRSVFAFLLLAVSAVFWSGCGRPQVAPEHLRFTAELRTALSAQNVEWLERTEKLVEERHEAGGMSEPEYEAFRSIIERAHRGEWEAAEREVLALQKAQRPRRE